MTLAPAGSTPPAEDSATGCGKVEGPPIRCRAHLDKHGNHTVGGGVVGRFSGETTIDGLCPIGLNAGGLVNMASKNGRSFVAANWSPLNQDYPTNSVLAQSHRSASVSNNSGSRQIYPIARAVVVSRDSSRICQFSCIWNLRPSLVNAKVCLTSSRSPGQPTQSLSLLGIFKSLIVIGRQYR